MRSWGAGAVFCVPAPRQLPCPAGGLLLFVLRPCVIVQREQSFPISCAAVAALSRLVYGGGGGARTDRTARPGNGVEVQAVPLPRGGGNAEVARAWVPQNPSSESG